MAAIKVTTSDASFKQDGSAIKAVWAAVDENSTFAPLQAPEYSQRSVHVSGTFGGSTVVLNGSNTGTNFFGLHDLQDAAFSVTSEGLEQIQEGVLQYQPAASGGTGQSLTVTMLFVGPRRY